MYNRVTAADVAALQAICGQTNVLCGEAINPEYAHDELGDVRAMPEVVVRVGSTEEVSTVMKLAWEKTIPVTVRGSGTGLVGAAVPIHGGILLETTSMNKILALDPDNLTVHGSAAQIAWIRIVGVSTMIPSAGSKTVPQRDSSSRMYRSR